MKGDGDGWYLRCCTRRRFYCARLRISLSHLHQIAAYLCVGLRAGCTLTNMLRPSSFAKKKNKKEVRWRGNLTWYTPLLSPFPPCTPHHIHQHLFFLFPHHSHIVQSPWYLLLSQVWSFSPPSMLILVFVYFLFLPSFLFSQLTSN